MPLWTLLPGRFHTRSGSKLGRLVLMISMGSELSCARQPSLSAVKHDLNQTVRDPSAWNWHSATDDDYADLMAPLLGIDPATILETSDPLVQRAQFWLDQVDQLVRSKHPAELANVPKPQAKVLKNSVPNAFVAPLPTCLNAALDLGGSADLDRVYLDVKTGALVPWPAELQCKDDVRDSAEVVKAFVAKFNASSQACQFSLTSSGALKPNELCKKEPALAAAGGAAGLVIMETANFVTVHSAILPIMTENDFASVLAHELGHYYRSHVTAPKSDYDYFYTLTATEPDHKPLPEADKAELGLLAVSASAILSSGDAFAKVSSQRLGSELYPLVGSLVTQVAQSSGSAAVCSDAAALLTSSGYAAVMATFPLLTKPSPAQIANYQDFETRSLACLATLKFSAHDQLGASSLGFDTLAALTAAPTWPAWLSAVPPAAKARLSQLNQGVAARIGTLLPEAKTGQDALLQLSLTLAAQDQASLDVLSQLHAQHVGQYTVEQEADDESAEWVSALGIDAEAGVDSMRSLGKDMRASLGGNVLSAADCDTLWRAGWNGADGQYSFVPLGNLTDPHHSVCYRMFNIEREIKAHKLVPAAVAVPTADGPAWSELQTKASSAAPARAAAFGRRSQVHPLVARTGAMSCTFSYQYQP